MGRAVADGDGTVEGAGDGLGRAVGDGVVVGGEAGATVGVPPGGIGVVVDVTAPAGWAASRPAPVSVAPAPSSGCDGPQAAGQTAAKRHASRSNAFLFISSPFP
jgi:hypothetical protein